MAFFLETLLGGLMSGMLYSLVALGFVLIYKASGVFNFSQGAMVLFAALSMARFSEWIPQWLGIDSLLLANVLAFAVSMAVMLVVAWLIERLVLRHLVNQEGATLLMATLGIGYADGVHRALSNVGAVELRDRLAPIVGRVTMDFVMVAPDVPVEPGEVATVFGGLVSLDDQAKRAGTISYELLTSMGPRIPRRYHA